MSYKFKGKEEATIEHTRHWKGGGGVSEKKVDNTHTGGSDIEEILT